MRLVLAVHILAGSLGLLSGYVALYAGKGSRLHRRSGMVFVFTMLAMCTMGALLAAVHWQVWSMVNLPAAVLTGYLVITSLATVRRPGWWSRTTDIALMLPALGISLALLPIGFEAIASGGRWNGIPAFPFFLFGIIGLLASAGDLRVIRSGALKGVPRVTRHLWRMSFALLIAAMSFFFGQARVIPKPIRIPALLAIPVLAVLVTLLYWLWRVRIRRTLRGISTLNASGAMP